MHTCTMSSDDQDMNLSVNGQSMVPPGFRFHPTEEELLQYYLRKRVAAQKIDLGVIRDIDLNKLEPWDIQEKCRIGSSTLQSDWYLFSHKDKKYPTGTRTNRATAAGFWKATGRDKAIYSGLRRIGMRKTLVFYWGRAPHGAKSDWIMHEYRLDDNNNVSNIGGDSGTEEGWVVCRVFKKKDHHKPAPAIAQMPPFPATLPRNDDILNNMMAYMGIRSPPSTLENMKSTASGHLPGLESPPAPPPDCTHRSDPTAGGGARAGSGWADLDRLVASQLNGLPSWPQFINEDFSSTFHDEKMMNMHDDDDHDVQTGLWSFTRSSMSTSSSSSDPARRHLSA